MNKENINSPDVLIDNIQISNKNNITKKILKIIALLIVLVGLITGLVFLILGNASKTKEIKLGKDRIVTLYSVVGERKITTSSSSTDKQGSKKTYIYEDHSVELEDLQKYINKLQEDGFLIISNTATNIQLALNSIDETKIILVEIEFTIGNTTTINYSKIKGTLTPIEN